MDIYNYRAFVTKNQSYRNQKTRLFTERMFISIVFCEMTIVCTIFQNVRSFSDILPNLRFNVYYSCLYTAIDVTVLYKNSTELFSKTMIGKYTNTLTMVLHSTL
jgi:hypothetical protein